MIMMMIMMMKFEYCFRHWLSHNEMNVYTVQHSADMG